MRLSFTLSPLPKRSGVHRGFTLIEVVLVLAIGGLIFLLAFLAFGQASKNRRDTQRRSDARKIIAEAENFAADNGGKYPCAEMASNLCGSPPAASPDPSTSMASFRTNYLAKDNFKDPSNNANYATTMYAYGPTTDPQNAVSAFLDPSRTDPPGRLFYAISAQCSGNSPVKLTGPLMGSISVWIKLESGSGYCVDNS